MAQRVCSLWSWIESTWLASHRLETEHGRRDLNCKERKGCNDDPSRCSPDEAEGSSRTIGSEFALGFD
jgi:hypothetical protein